MRILFIAPLPPPLGGHSLVAKVLYDALVNKHEVEAVNFNKNSFVEGISSFKRIFEIFSILIKVRKGQKNADVIYLTISESFAGNLKDIFIYFDDMKNNMNIGNNGNANQPSFWAITISFKFNEPVSNMTLMMIRPMETS